MLQKHSYTIVLFLLLLTNRTLSHIYTYMYIHVDYAIKQGFFFYIELSTACIHDAYMHILYAAIKSEITFKGNIEQTRTCKPL